MEFRLLLLDVDGTLVESNGEALPTPRVIAAVSAAQEQLHVALATGRPYQLAQPVAAALGLRGLSVFNGGAEIGDVVTGELVHQQLLGATALREVMRLVIPFGYGVYLSDDNRGTLLRKADEIQRDAPKLFIGNVAAAHVPHILEEIRQVEECIASPTTSWGGDGLVDIHVVHRKATKYHGAEQLLRMLGVSKDQTMAIVDYHNDLPLFEAAGFKVAMGNAPPEVQAAADYVAPPLWEDGAAVAIEHIILQRH